MNSRLSRINNNNASTDQGFVNVNDNLNIQESSWSGDYFETIPVTLKAVPELGYEFSHWSGDLFSTDQIIEISIDQAFEVIPNFTFLSTQVVINEINYNSSDDFNPDDWIELYNPKPTAIDISNWLIKDDNDNHVFTIPAGTQIEGNDYLVIVKDESDFISVFMIFLTSENLDLDSEDMIRSDCTIPITI